MTTTTKTRKQSWKQRLATTWDAAPRFSFEEKPNGITEVVDTKKPTTKRKYQRKPWYALREDSTLQLIDVCKHSDLESAISWALTMLKDLKQQGKASEHYTLCLQAKNLSCTPVQGFYRKDD